MNTYKKLFLMLIASFQLITSCPALKQVGKMVITERPKFSIDLSQYVDKHEVAYMEQDEKNASIIYMLTRSDNHNPRFFTTYAINLSNSKIEKLYESLSLREHTPDPHVFENSNPRIHYKLLGTYQENVFGITQTCEEFLLHPTEPISIQLRINSDSQFPQKNLTFIYRENFNFSYHNPKSTVRIKFKLNFDRAICLCNSYREPINTHLCWFPPHYLITFIYPYLFIFKADVMQGNVVYKEQDPEKPEIIYILTKVDKPDIDPNCIGFKVDSAYHSYSINRSESRFNKLHTSIEVFNYFFDIYDGSFQSKPNSIMHYNLLHKYKEKHEHM